MVIGSYISIITLNVNGLNSPTKIHRLAKLMHRNMTPYMLFTRDKEGHYIMIKGGRQS